MNIDDVHKYEQVVISFLNFDHWNLKWCGGSYEHYDAIGKTPKGFDCVIEMKFRNKYYPDKMLEKYKYDKLFGMDKDIVKLYYVHDPKGNYLFYLNTLKMPEPVDMWCPDTTLWSSKKKLKPCYLLQENLAAQITYDVE